LIKQEERTLTLNPRLVRRDPLLTLLDALGDISLEQSDQLGRLSLKLLLNTRRSDNVVDGVPLLVGDRIDQSLLDDMRSGL
jgi:hypothetical protein